MSVTIVNPGGGGARGFNGSVVLTRDGGVCTSPYCDETDDDWFLGAVNLPGLAASP